MSRIALILLALAGTASAADRCIELADLAAAVAEHRAAGVPQSAIASQLRAQYREDTEERRNANAMTERVVQVVYQDDKAPAALHEDVKTRCEAGEFNAKEKP